MFKVIASEDITVRENNFRSLTLIEILTPNRDYVSEHYKVFVFIFNDHAWLHGLLEEKKAA